MKFNNHLIIILIGILALMACEPMETIKPCPNITANFNFEIMDNNCSSECPVSFKSLTTTLPENAAFRWEFGDGTTSSEVNPTHYFKNTGSYQAKLTISELEDCGISHATERTITLKTPPEGECIEFDPTTIQIKANNGNYQILDGSTVVKEFAELKEEALETYDIIRHYGITTICEIDAPNFEYALVNDKGPRGSVPGEDCLSFNPATLEVQLVSGRWKIVDGSHWMFDFNKNELAARMAFNAIQRYGFTKTCFVGRPYASFKYLRQ